MIAAVAQAAAKLGSLAVVEAADGAANLIAKHGHVFPLISSLESAASGPIREAPLVMIRDSENVLQIQERLKEKNADRLVAIRVEANPAVKQRVLALARDGAEVIHLVFDAHGREAASDAAAPRRHARDVLREIHRALVMEGIRDQVTLVSSGGIAQPEHMAKAIICGADLVAIDVPLLLALECRLCGQCAEGETCPVALEDVDESMPSAASRT